MQKMAKVTMTQSCLVGKNNIAIPKTVRTFIKLPRTVWKEIIAWVYILQSINIFKQLDGVLLLQTLIMTHNMQKVGREE